MLVYAPITPPPLRPGGTRLRVEVMGPRPQCPARPRDLDALWTSVTHRAHHGYGHHAPCLSACPPCRRVQVPTRHLLAPTVLREDEEDRPWLMHRQAGGWAERGLLLPSWGAVLEYAVTFGAHIERDEHSRFLALAPAAAPAGEQGGEGA